MVLDIIYIRNLRWPNRDHIILRIDFSKEEGNQSIENKKYN